MRYDDPSGAALLGKLSRKKKAKVKRGIMALLPIPGARVAAAVAARRAKKGKPVSRKTVAKRAVGAALLPPGIVPGAGIARIIAAGVARRKKQAADKKKAKLEAARRAAGLQVVPTAPPMATTTSAPIAPVSVPPAPAYYEPPSNEPDLDDTADSVDESVDEVEQETDEEENVEDSGEESDE